jgi:hypothetical protein
MSGGLTDAKRRARRPLDGRVRPHCSPDQKSKPEKETKPDADSKCASGPARQQRIRMETLTSDFFRNASEKAGKQLTCSWKNSRG